MEQEIWKSVLGYEGFYEISNLGRVKSLDRQSKKNNRVYKGRVLNCTVRHGYREAVKDFGTGVKTDSEKS